MSVSDDDVSRAVLIAKALADPVRLRIFSHLASECCSTVCTCRIPETFGISQPTFSHHAKKLVEAGLVRREKIGKWVHYSIIPGGAQPLFDVVSQVESCCAQPDNSCF
ncbi:ArsR/SmtB family transcription factor [Arcanobacterium ihumii]|uniref:ArsR/SmtB family transcription factor n=1 Tax=Arcanobacterium ihumii TaxID=2138162 RepID=UPI000F52E501|nr:metalloregulator ArsR/SmtB family transcription factor [Arcanobacterium ihumii]